MACLLARGQGRAMGSTTVHYAHRSSSRGLGSTDRIHRLYVLRSFGVKVCALVAVSAACLDKTGGPWTLLYCPDSGRASELRRGLRQWRVEVGWQMTHLPVRGVRKSFGSFTAVDGVSFSPRARLSHCWVQAGAARRLCCGRSPGWSSRTTVRSFSAVKRSTRGHAACLYRSNSGASGLSFSRTRSGRT